LIGLAGACALLASCQAIAGNGARRPEVIDGPSGYWAARAGCAAGLPDGAVGSSRRDGKLQTFKENQLVNECLRGRISDGG
jgi:hypothetical protein